MTSKQRNILILVWPVLMFTALYANCQCPNQTLVTFDQYGGYSYSWCFDQDVYDEYCFDYSCILQDPCVAQPVCFTFEATSTFPYYITMDGSLFNQYHDDGVHVKFILFDEDCEEIYLLPCLNDWQYGSEYITIDNVESEYMDTPDPWVNYIGSDWTLVLWLPFDTYTLCINPTIDNDGESGGCMDLTIFSPGLLGLSITEVEKIMKEGYDFKSSVKIAYLRGELLKQIR